MRIVTSILIAISIVLSIGICKLTSDTRSFNNRIKNAEKEIASLKAQITDLDKYKDEKGISLDKFYLEVFNDIKEVSFYYHASSEIKIPEAKDLVSLFRFFKPSQYRGIRCVDVLCRINLKDLSGTYIFETLYKIIRDRPIDILDAEIEKDVLSLTMRLYGS